MPKLYKNLLFPLYSISLLLLLHLMSIMYIALHLIIVYNVIITVT